MSANSYQRRIRRAEELSIQHPSAAELLGFYGRLARYQEEERRRINGPAKSFSDTPGWDQLLPSSRSFLLMVEEHGPARLADVALRLRSNEIESAWPELLSAIWTDDGRVPSEPEDFLARMFLQPYAEWIRSRLPVPRDCSSQRQCPCCGRRPVAGILRPQGDGALRSLLCSFCLGEWEFRRILCANCGEEDNKKLPVYTATEFPHTRLDCCDSCMTYTKAIDLTKTGLAEPVVDEIAAIPLDLWAQEKGYAKLHPNCLGL